MSSVDTSFLEDLPIGPLDVYRKQARFHWKRLKLVFEDAEYLKIKLKIWKTLESDPLFQGSLVVPSTEEMKRLTALRLDRFRRYNFLPPTTWPYKRRTKFLMTANEALAVCFPDVSVKQALGVSLFTNAVSTLGTERHQTLVDMAWNNQLLSCVALTEVAHGSDTKQMRTTATYSKETQEFVINTPDFEAAKCWVGNLGKTCTVALLFAQLHTGGQCYGLHVFLVPIRDPKTLKPYPGIIVGDIGEKIGLNGIDNGFIMFNNYRIPREFLLNRTADVTPDGEYESSFSEPGRILGAALENLSTGRVGIMQESSNNLISAVTIAVRYAAVRKQFSPNNGNYEELPLVEYELHQWRLFGYVAAAAVLRVFVNSFTDVFLTVVEQSTTSERLEDLNNKVAEIHAIVSATKPLITWTCRDAAQECREACGGHGFLKSARIGDIKNTNDPTVTYEGDNNVLVQQTSNWLLRQWQMLLEEKKLSCLLGSCRFLVNKEEIIRRRFSLRHLQDICDYNFIKGCYEWLVVFLIAETDRKQKTLLQNNPCKFAARNNSQVYKAAALSRVYAEFTALSLFWDRIHQDNVDESSRIVLKNLGVLYGLWCLDKHLPYFYQGGYAVGSEMTTLVKDGILHCCKLLKPDVVGVVDAMAPPDFALNSVLGKADGNLYKHLETEFFHNPSAMERPKWWQEIAFKEAPDIMTIKSKL